MEPLEYCVELIMTHGLIHQKEYLIEFGFILMILMQVQGTAGQRFKYKHLMMRDESIMNTWTPFQLEKRRFQRGKGTSCYKIVIKQFPFIPAEAITIHKAREIRV